MTPRYTSLKKVVGWITIPYYWGWYKLHQLAVWLLYRTSNHHYVVAEMYPHMADVLYGMFKAYETHRDTCWYTSPETDALLEKEWTPELNEFHAERAAEDSREMGKRVLEVLDYLRSNRDSKEYKAALETWHQLRQVSEDSPEEEVAFDELQRIESREYQYRKEILRVLADNFEGLWS